MPGSSQYLPPAMAATVTLVVIAVAWPARASITVATVETTSTKRTELTTTVGNAEMTLGGDRLQDPTTPWYEFWHLALSHPTASDGDGQNNL